MRDGVAAPRSARASTTTSRATSGPTMPRRSRCSARARRTWICPMHLRRYRSDIFTDKYKRLAWDEVSRSITAHIAKDGYWYIHPAAAPNAVRSRGRPCPDVPRLVPVRRPAEPRLRQIGNAVPPLLGEALGRQLAVRAGRRHRAATTTQRSTSGRPARRGTRVNRTRLSVADRWQHRPVARSRRRAVPRAHARRSRARASTSACARSRRLRACSLASVTRSPSSKSDRPRAHGRSMLVEIAAALEERFDGVGPERRTRAPLASGRR